MPLVLGRLVVPPAVGVVGHRHAGIGRLLGDRDEVVERTLRLHVAPVAVQRGVPALEQEAIRHRRVPGELLDPGGPVPNRRRLRCRRRHAWADAGTSRRPVVAGAAALAAVFHERGTAAVLRQVEIKTDLVARCDLAGDAAAVQHLAESGAHAHVVVFQIAPLRRIARILVRIQIAGVHVRALGPEIAVEPDSVLDNRAAERKVAVPVLTERGRVAKPEIAQGLIDVAGPTPLTGKAAEIHAAEVVTAGLRNDVEGGSATIGFAQTARDADLYFGGVVHVVQIP